MKPRRVRITFDEIETDLPLRVLRDAHVGAYIPPKAKGLWGVPHVLRPARKATVEVIRQQKSKSGKSTLAKRRKAK